MTDTAEPSTLDTNVAIHAFSDEEVRATLAREKMLAAAFVSAQLLNEFANVVARKQHVSWPEIAKKIADIKLVIPRVIPLGAEHNHEALRIADRYRLSFYDSLMLAVAIDGGARVIYSEDMQSGMIIDDVLRIVNPYTAEPA